MPTNQKYSGRIHTRRQLVSINNHLVSAINQLNAIGQTYAGVLPAVATACVSMMEMIELVKAMVWKVRDEI